RVDHAEDGAAPFQEGLPGWQEPDASGRALEEGRPELVLEAADLAAQRGLGEVEPAGGAADVALLRHGDEVSDLRQAHHRRVAREACLPVGIGEQGARPPHLEPTTASRAPGPLPGVTIEYHPIRWVTSSTGRGSRSGTSSSRSSRAGPWGSSSARA